jgi:hypothetical protein
VLARPVEQRARLVERHLHQADQALDQLLGVSPPRLTGQREGVGGGGHGGGLIL